MAISHRGLKARILVRGSLRLVLVVVVAATGFVGLQTLQGALDGVIESHKITGVTADVQREAIRMQAGLQAFLITGDVRCIEAYRAARKKALDGLEDLRKRIAEDADQLRTLSQAENTAKEWIGVVAEKVLAVSRGALATSGNSHELSTLVAEGEPILDRFVALLESVRSGREDLLAAQVSQSEATATRTKAILVVGTILILAASVLLSLVAVGGILRPVKDAADLAEALSKQDLTRKLDVTATDEIGRLCSTLNLMATTWADQVGRLREAAHAVSASASEISATAGEVTSAISRTTAAVNQSASTAEEVRQAAQFAGDRAKAVAAGAKQALQVSGAGTRAAEDTVGKIGLIRDQMASIGDTVVRLSGQSQAIEQIITSVQDLANQSNLLAVNASIEASRAGEYGKGFAVVAQEIKNLADQSKEATAQVRAILEDTRKLVSAVVMAAEQGGKAVEAGAEQARLAGSSIGTLGQSISEWAQAAEAVDVSSAQQAMGAEQVSGAMKDIQSSMGQNLTAVSQLENAARQLADLSRSVTGLLAAYKVAR